MDGTYFHIILFLNKKEGNGMDEIRELLGEITEEQLIDYLHLLLCLQDSANSLPQPVCTYQEASE